MKAIYMVEEILLWCVVAAIGTTLWLTIEVRRENREKWSYVAQQAQKDKMLKQKRIDAIAEMQTALDALGKRLDETDVKNVRKDKAMEDELFRLRGMIK